MDVRHRHLAARVAHPDGGREARREPDEPGIGVLVGRAGLARNRPVERRGGSRPVANVVLEDARDDRCDAVGNDARAAVMRGPAVVALAVQDHPADRGGLGVDASGGERGIGRRHVERRDRDRAEAHRRRERAVHLQRRADAEPAGHRGDPCRADVERQLRVDRVVGAQGRPLDGRPARVARVVGPHAPPAAVVAVAVCPRAVRERCGDVVGRGRVHPALDRRGEDEGLEGRARLAACLREQVELVVRPARDDRRHRADRAVRGVDGDDRRGGIGLSRERVGDRLLREPLPARLDRRVHLETARADRLRAVGLHELVADVAEEVRLADLLVEPAGAEPDRLPARPAVLGRGDHRLLEHRVEDLVATLARAHGVGERVVGRRGLRQPGDERSLGQGERPRRAGEVRARGRLRAVGEVPVEDRVEVAPEDLLLRPGVVELHGQARLLDLALHGPLVRDVEVADELLGDRRAALDHLPGLDVPPQRARDALRVDPAVVVEAAILDGDRRLAEPRRHLAERHDLPIPLGRDHAEQRAVRRVDERVLADPGRAERVEVALRAEGEHRAARRDARGDEDEREQHEDERELPPALGPGTPPAHADGRRGRATRTGAPRAAHAAMVATSCTGFRVRDATPRAACRVIVAACAAPSQRRGRRFGSSSGAAWRSGRWRRARCSSSRTSSTPRAAGGTRRGSTSSAPPSTCGRAGTRTGTCASPRAGTAGRRARPRSSPATRCSSLASAARSGIASCSPAWSSRSRVRRRVRSPLPARRRAARRARRVPVGPLPRALPDVVLPRCGVRRVVVPPARGRDVRARRTRAARMGRRRVGPRAAHPRAGHRVAPRARRVRMAERPAREEPRAAPRPGRDVPRLSTGARALDRPRARVRGRAEALGALARSARAARRARPGDR